jgi:hypothetical protein
MPKRTDIARQEFDRMRTTKIHWCGRSGLTDCGQDDAAKPMLTILRKGFLQNLRILYITLKGEKTENV